MNQNPLVSIVTPLYNHRKYLPRTVEAVLSQTHENWEWIVCDDCSTDGSYEFMQIAAKQEPRIKLMRNDVNSKIVITTQRCMDEAKGEFMYILDSDDYCKPEYLAEMIRLLNTHPTASVGFARCFTMDANDGYWGAWPKRKPFFRAGLEEFPNQLLNYSMKGTTTLYRMSMCKVIGGWGAHPLTRMHDKYYDLRALMEGDVAYTDKPLGYYRVHATNHSSNTDEQIIPDVAEEVFGMVDDLMARVPENKYFNKEELHHQAKHEYSQYVSHLVRLAEKKGRVDYAEKLKAILAARGIRSAEPKGKSAKEKIIDLARPVVKKLTYEKLPPIKHKIKQL